jgi:hypothetical protein
MRKMLKPSNGLYRDQDADTVHGTQKPVECMRRPILPRPDRDAEGSRADAV